MKPFARLRAAALAAVLTALLSPSLPVSAADAPNLLSTDRWVLVTPSPGDARLDDLRAGGDRSGPQVLRVTVQQAAEPFYRIQLAQVVSRAVPASRRLRLTFRARSQTRNTIRVVLEQAGAPYAAAAEWSGPLSAEWKQYSLIGVSPGYDANGLAARLQVGQAKGVIEFADIALTELSEDPELTAARAAVQKEAMEARIRKLRMGDLKIVVKDQAGRTVRDARVKIEQTRHAFLFGCNIFQLDPNDSGEWQKRYQERFQGLFNFATLPFYWGSYEARQGEPQHTRLEAMAKWCAERGIVTKGHPLVWHEVWPRWAPGDPDEAGKLLRARVLDLVPRYAGLVTYWDVLNEANNAHDYPATGVGAWVRRDGAAKVVEEALAWAREAASGSRVTLLYNDFNTTERNVQLLADLEKAMSLPDAIGIQSHMHGRAWPIEEAWRTTERFARFRRPIHYTELTVPSGGFRSFDFRNPPSGWSTTPEGEREQADYVEKLYSVLFSHPSVEAITWWDFSDRGAWMRAPAGLLRADMSPKPAYDRLMELIRKRWWTTTETKTNSRGRASARAFFGDYRIKVEDGKGGSTVRTVKHSKGTPPSTVEMRLP